MFKIHRKLFDRKGNVIMKDRIVRGIFFGVSVLLIALFISEIGTDRSNLWLAVLGMYWYFCQWCIYDCVLWNLIQR